MTQASLYAPPPEIRLSLARPVAIAVVLMFALVFGLGTWATQAKLNAAVIASGVVKVDRELRTAQHIDGGTVTEILVVPGQSVEAGEALLRLDTFEVESELALLGAQLREVRARIARLEAERESLPTLVVPATSLESDPALAAAFEGEARLLENDRRERKARRQALALQSERLTHEAEALGARRASLAHQLDLAAEALARDTELVARGAVAESRLTDAATAHARLAGDLAEVEARLMGNRVEKSKIELEITELESGAISQAHRELRELAPRLAELELQVRAREAVIGRSVVRAPVAGTVNEVPVNTIGQVVAPGETLVTVVPRDARLVIEFKVATTDIDQIAPGQAARLRFAAFDQRTTPEFPGVVTHIAAASVVDAATGASFYIANAEPEGEISLPDGARLVPGMPVEVYLTTRERTPLDYLVQPVRDSMERAMTEW